MTPKSDIDLYIEVDVLTAGTAAEVVNAILETLLYQRNQIPFVYKTYRYYVNKWQEQKEKESSLGEECSLQSFQVQRKKEQATNTKDSINSMRQTIKTIFEKKPIKSVRFLFGSTVFTAKESYTVHIPTENIASNHFHEHHKISPGKLNQTLLSLLTSESLYTVFSNNLNPTNIYLELELLDNDNFELITHKNSLKNSQMFPKDFLLLPRSCKDIHINLLHKHSSTTTQSEKLKCCKELEVFQDLINLTSKCSIEPQKESTHDKNDKVLTSLTSVWWEAEIVVRGFKDQPKLTCKEKITNRWLYNHLHGLCWDDGNSTIDEFREYLTSTLKDQEDINIYVKGLEKAIWIKQQIAKEKICIFNLDEYNCPNIRTL